MTENISFLDNGEDLLEFLKQVRKRNADLNTFVFKQDLPKNQTLALEELQIKQAEEIQKPCEKSDSCQNVSNICQYKRIGFYCKRKTKQQFCWQHSKEKKVIIEGGCPRKLLYSNRTCGQKLYKRGVCYRHWRAKHLWD